ncbi:MAG: hypothetical protein AAFQ58_05370 [Pseudomonadota bacterium]
MALETGLQVVILANRPFDQPDEYEDMRPPRVTFIHPDARTDRREHLTSAIQLTGERFGMPSQDLLCITDASCEELECHGCRATRLRDAVQVLDTFSLKRRLAAFDGYQPITSEMVHTVLVPLDLAIGATPDADRLNDLGRLLFDTVLMMKNLVPTSGFAAKSLKKLVAGYAPIVYGFAEDGEPEEVFREALLRLSAGAGEAIFVSKVGAPDAQTAHLRQTRGNLVSGLPSFRGCNWLKRGRRTSDCHPVMGQSRTLRNHRSRRSTGTSALIH